MIGNNGLGKYNQGDFTPKNPKKYIGTYPIRYRSSWELTFMNLCDAHPNIAQWASESIEIPYKNPMKVSRTNPTGHSIYIPDFLVVYMDKKGKQHAELIEIKPMKECLAEKATTQRDKVMVAINHAKWKAAEAWCKRHGIIFRVMTEHQLYKN